MYHHLSPHVNDLVVSKGSIMNVVLNICSHTFSCFSNVIFAIFYRYNYASKVLRIVISVR